MSTKKPEVGPARLPCGQFYVTKVWKCGITSSNAGLVVCIQHGGDQAVFILGGGVDRVATILELIQGSLAHDDAIGCQVRVDQGCTAGGISICSHHNSFC